MQFHRSILLLLGLTLRSEASAAEPVMEQGHWAYRPVARPSLPRVRQRHWVTNPIDAFVIARLEASGLSPNRPATKRELIRRAYFDLIGLPPAPEAVAAFEADPSPAAWTRVIDGLLAQPQYGERWGRHWLDVVRYGQTNGYERDAEKPFAWRYRDYVIQALNLDVPYDRFVREQLAGDELPDASMASLVATGYYRVGAWDDEPDDKRLAEYDELDDFISTTGQAFLGSTIGCARCHDHKFDPFTQRDYYALVAIFHNVRPYAVPSFASDSPTLLPLTTPEVATRWQQEVRTRLAALEAEMGSEQDSRKREALRRQLEELRANPPPFPLALAVRDRPTQAPATRLLVRGNPANPGDEVRPGFPASLTSEAPKLVPTSGRRLALAEWIASEANPLTARVIVNRTWRHHFGRGIVPTPNDFGRAGRPPSHPELLDWLASEFVVQGWSLKQLHRLIMQSSAYQMSSIADNVPARSVDEGNVRLWRQQLRRVEAEVIRDAALAVSGQLNLSMGGRGIFPKLSREVLAGQSRPGNGWEESPPTEQSRRSVYLFVKRTLLVPLLESFDFTNTTTPVGERASTTVAPQALMLLNGEFFQQQATAWATRLQREAGESTFAQVERAYRLAFGRSPSDTEQRIALRYLQERSLKGLCLVLLNLNEFVYVD